MIGALLLVIGYRQIALVGVLLSVVWLIVALSVHREYVQMLARSIAGRFASLRGGFASIADVSTQSAVRRALAAADPLQVSFALDLAFDSDAAVREAAVSTLRNGQCLGGGGGSAALGRRPPAHGRALLPHARCGICGPGTFHHARLHRGSPRGRAAG